MFLKPLIFGFHLIVLLTQLPYQPFSPDQHPLNLMIYAKYHCEAVVRRTILVLRATLLAELQLPVMILEVLLKIKIGGVILILIHIIVCLGLGWRILLIASVISIRSA